MAENNESSEPTLIICQPKRISMPKPKNLKIKINKINQNAFKNKCKTPYIGQGINSKYKFRMYNQSFNLYDLSNNSLKDIEQDFNILKTKSQIQKTRDEIKNLLCSSDASSNVNDLEEDFLSNDMDNNLYYEVERPKNPFFKNLE